MKAKLSSTLIPRPTTIPPTTIPPPTTTPFLHSCDEGWRNFNGHCYLLVKELKTWDNASVACQNRHSYLIEITTDAEFEFAVELMIDKLRYTFWIGARDRDLNGTFVYQHSQQPVPEEL